jgi:hypothetical protein
MHSRALLFSTIILFGLSTAYPAASQNPQDRGKGQQARPAPNGNQAKPGGNNRPQPSRPSPGGNRPQPSKPNPGGSRPQPSKPNPGGSRPQPSKPNPGGNRPQPSRPNPGRPNPSRPQPGRPNPGRPNQGRPPQWGHRPTNRPSYSFRNNDRAYLHRYYQSRFGTINRLNRPRFVIGGFFPYAYISYIQPLPPDVYGYLPPPPMGYSMGYYQGYVVVYDPITYFIANVIDILQ